MVIITSLFDRTFPGKAFGMTRGSNNLADKVMDVVVIPGIGLRRWDTDRILAHIIMCSRKRSELLNRDKIVRDILDKGIHSTSQYEFGNRRGLAFRITAVPVDGLVVIIRVNGRHHGLVNIEKRADLTVVNALVLGLLLRWKGQIVLACDDVIRLVAIDIPVPVVPVERDTLLR